MNFRKQVALHQAGFNITPLIDILLVLIIFFVLTWNFSRDEQEVDVKVPSSKEGSDSRPRPGEIILNIKRDGAVMLHGRQMDPDQLLQTLKRVASEFPDQAIILRGDKDLPLQELIRIMDVCTSANIRNVAFATQGEKAP
jgi:biopolymer transport protein ExbD